MANVITTSTPFKATYADASGMEMTDHGACIACGEQADGVEPDAEKYECESCGAKAVYGLPELALMGLLELTTDFDGVPFDKDGNRVEEHHG